jgi:hypothetical protein
MLQGGGGGRGKRGWWPKQCIHMGVNVKMIKFKKKKRKKMLTEVRSYKEN